MMEKLKNDGKTSQPGSKSILRRIPKRRLPYQLKNIQSSYSINNVQQRMIQNQEQNQRKQLNQIKINNLKINMYRYQKELNKIKIDQQKCLKKKDNKNISQLFNQYQSRRSQKCFYINGTQMGLKQNSFRSGKYLPIHNIDNSSQFIVTNSVRKTQTKLQLLPIPNNLVSNLTYLKRFDMNKNSKSTHMKLVNGNHSLRKAKQKIESLHTNSSNQIRCNNYQQSINNSSPSTINLISMFRSQQGVQLGNPNKVNQDRVLIKQNYEISQGRKINIYAVADGHGLLGHFVSSYVTQNILDAIQMGLKQHCSVNVSIFNAYKYLQSKLAKNCQFNSDLSGSTLVTILVQNQKFVTCANVGDSRAFIARQTRIKNWQAIQLSNDHKPNLVEERKRIIKHGGRISTLYDENGDKVGPMRVWLPKQSNGLIMLGIQGLAMSRSLGDNISKSIGVTSQPEILRYQLSTNDRFLLLASDGIWQFLSNIQILNMIVPYYQQNKLHEACQMLVNQARKSWVVQERSIIDDISFVLVFIRQPNDIYQHRRYLSDMVRDKKGVVNRLQANNSSTATIDNINITLQHQYSTQLPYKTEIESHQ